MPIKQLLVVASLLCGIQPIARGSGTIVGNGGDPVYDFLEATSSSMIETIKLILLDPKEQQIFCANKISDHPAAKKLDEDQVHFCHDFFMTVAPDILRLGQGPNKTIFTLPEGPLQVVGPDGKTSDVPARTELGPDGVIEFHRDSIKSLLPTEVLFLMTHEFQHKASFRGRSIGDNEAMPPFVNGRELIDNVAKAVVEVARRRGKIGSQFGILDTFECVTFIGPVKIGGSTTILRNFSGETLLSYQVSAGRNPADKAPWIPVTDIEKIRLFFQITEPNNCGDPTPERKISMKIIRSIQTGAHEFTETVLAAAESKTNPICPDANPRFEIAWQKNKFSCQYFGTEGTASTAAFQPAFHPSPANIGR